MENTFQERLQYLIDAKKITQAELSASIGIGESRVSEWLSGKVQKPRRTTIQKLTDYFSCNIDWLADGKGEIWRSKSKKPYQNKDADSEKHLNNNYSKLAQLDEKTLQEIQAWLNEMEKQKPGFKSWFRLEFQNRFPEFEEWKEK